MTDYMDAYEQQRQAAREAAEKAGQGREGIVRPVFTRPPNHFAW